MNFLSSLNSWRTYICVLLMIVTGVLNFYHVFDPELYKLLLGILGPLALAAINSASNQAQVEAKKTQEMIRGLNKS